MPHRPPAALRARPRRALAGAPRLLAACLALGATAALPGACADPPTGAEAADGRTAALSFSASVAATPEVATMALTVTAPDIPTPIVVNLTIADGVASGTVRLPPGAARTITAQAFDRSGAVAYEGEVTVSVRPGQNPPVAITLVGASGKVPITATLGSVSLAVTPGTGTLFLGERRQLAAALRDAAGNAVAGEVTWASANPALATVDATGRVTAHAAGTVDVVATFAGVAARAALVVEPRSAQDLILFEAHEPNRYPYLGRVASDGSGFLAITPTYADGRPIPVFSPAWSPDRGRIAFVGHGTPTGGSYDLWVTNADGTGARRIVDMEGVEWHPRWSPDGTRLVFDYLSPNEPAQLYTVRPDGSELTRVTSGPAHRQFAAWSPDGARIAYSHFEAGRTQVYVMSPDGGGQRPVRADGATGAGPQWSPDGARLSFATSEGLQGAGLYVMDADGTNTRRLTAPASGVDQAPVWSPDGQWLAFTSTRSGAAALYRIRPDGTGLAAIPLPAGVSPNQPSWR